MHACMYIYIYICTNIHDNCMYTKLFSKCFNSGPFCKSDHIFLTLTELL